MTGLVTLFVRAIMEHKHKSGVPTSILPLDKIHKAVLFLDDTEATADEAGRNAEKFFSENGIELIILCPKKWEIAWWGGLKRWGNTVSGKIKSRAKFADGIDEDLFISLAGEENYTGRFLSLCSRARFKAGRFNMGDVFDITVTNSDDSLPKQRDIFQAIKDILCKIK